LWKCIARRDFDRNRESGSSTDVLRPRVEETVVERLLAALQSGAPNFEFTRFVFDIGVKQVRALVRREQRMLVCERTNVVPGHYEKNDLEKKIKRQLKKIKRQLKKIKRRFEESGKGRQKGARIATLRKMERVF
tara:strand:- start:338 stop:739 length:402 start_codon:yes stop_codon:yes gene_type:complete